METLSKYLLNYEKTYSYRIKVPFEINKNVLAKIEKAAKKWDLENISKPEKTIIQKNPSDMNISNTEVWYVDITVKYPASPFLLQHEIIDYLSVPDNNVVIKVLKDGEEFDSSTKDLKDFQPLLQNTDKSEVDEIDQSDYYGNEHTSKFLDFMKKQSKEMPGPKEKADDNKVIFNNDSPLGKFNPKTNFPGGPK